MVRYIVGGIVYGRVHCLWAGLSFKIILEFRINERGCFHSVCVLFQLSCVRDGCTVRSEWGRQERAQEPGRVPRGQDAKERYDSYGRHSQRIDLLEDGGHPAAFLLERPPVRRSR